jgi:hypothetical protein
MNNNLAEHWNTIMMTFPLYDIRDPDSVPSSPPAEDQLVQKVLDAVLPVTCLQSTDPTTDTDRDDPELRNVPKRTALYQNTPNPFNPVTVIRFDLARPGRLQLRIYDVAGRQVRTLVDEPMQTGIHEVAWDGRDESGQRVASGVYLYRLVADEVRQTRKLVVMK